MSQLRRLKKAMKKERERKIKRQKAIFSLCFIVTIAISFIMLVICAINNAPTVTTTVVSGCARLMFEVVFAIAINKKWYLLSDKCFMGRISFPIYNTESERRKDNWQGNLIKFWFGVGVLVIHAVLLLVLLCR